MKNNSNGPSSAKNEGSNNQDQFQRFYRFLQTHLVTCTMASQATGIPQKNCCRFKRKLEKQGLLWEVKYSKCPITRFYAWFISCNPKLIPTDNQLKMFDNEEE